MKFLLLSLALFSGFCISAQQQKQKKLGYYYDDTIPNSIIEEAFRNTGLLYGSNACHGVFISPIHFLTVAHCIDGLKAQDQDIHVLSYHPYTYEGEQHLQRVNVRHSVKSFYSYTSNKLITDKFILTRGDFAVIELNDPVDNYFDFSSQNTNLKSDDDYCFLTDWRVSYNKKYKEYFNEAEGNNYFNKNIINLHKTKPFAGDGYFLSRFLKVADNLIVSGLSIIATNGFYLVDIGNKTWKQLYFSEKKIRLGSSGSPVWCYDKQTDSLHLNGTITSSTRDLFILKATSIAIANHLNDYTFNWIKDKITKK